MMSHWSRSAVWMALGALALSAACSSSDTGDTTGGGGSSAHAGTNGSAGTNGAAGTSGAAAGTSGAAAGTSGATAGTSGATAGTNGSAGTNGATGATGGGQGGKAGTTGGGQGGKAGSAGGGAAGHGGTSGAAAGTTGAAGTSGAAGSAGTAGTGGQPFKGVANSPCADRTALNISWYYNWEQTENEACTNGQGGVFVPMIWGHTGSEQSASGITTSISSFVSKGYPYVLGFNEPDNSTQSDIIVATAISLWPSFLNPAIKTVSPATQANTTGQAWFNTFIGDVNANSTGLRTDVIGLHWYGWNTGSCDAAASQLNGYLNWAEGFAGNRPIWLTEWGCLNDSAPDETTVVNFYKGALAVFAKHPRVQRYAWYPWSTNLALTNSDGSLTALGTVYAAAPSYK
jgi:Glycosyl hydrolase catalytic core